jgi:hypothetical protein
MEASAAAVMCSLPRISRSAGMADVETAMVTPSAMVAVDPPSDTTPYLARAAARIAALRTASDLAGSVHPLPFHTAGSGARSGLALRRRRHSRPPRFPPR